MHRLKPNHLGSHTWQLSAAVLIFPLKLAICYDSRSGYYVVLATVSSYILTLKINQYCAEIFYSRDRIEKNYHLPMSNNRPGHWVFFLQKGILNSDGVAELSIHIYDCLLVFTLTFG